MALRKSKQPDTKDQNWIQWATQAITKAQTNYKKFEDYYVGDHELAFATQKWEDAFGTVFEEFADNWCGVVVDSMCQRMEITGWRSEDEKSMAKEAEQIWDDNELGCEADDLHTQTAVKGDGYLIIWPDPDKKKNEPSSQIYYNDALEVTAYYDPANKRRMSRAAKRFTDEEGQTHLYLYFKDRIEKYFVPTSATADQIAAFQLNPPSMSALPAGWVQEDATVANPYGRIPVFHFRNRNLGATHGLSELKSVIPVQNAVNKMLMDMMVASEFGSFRQKWVAGAGQPTDGWRAGADRVWATTDPMAKFGEFGQIDLEPIFKAVEVLVGHLAKITQTPTFYLRSSGDMPSGEALKSSESGLVKKCLSRQKQWGASWSQAMTFALRVKGHDPKSPVYPVWKSPETRHDLEQAQTAQLKSILGIPLERLWSEQFGYTEEEIKQFRKANLAIAASVLADVMAQIGQAPPGTEPFAGDPTALIGLLKQGKHASSGGDTDVSQVLALLNKNVTAQTTAGEATTKPQPHTKPTPSPTRRGTGFKD